MSVFNVRVQEADFNISKECEALVKGKPGIGAVVTFTGRVRDRNAGRTLKALTLEHYPGMAEKQMQALLDQARAKFQIDAASIIHRFGRLYPEDQIVLVIACSAHRQDAFDAANFLMDWLKTSAPFWKKEEIDGTDSTWVEVRSGDQTAADRWSDKS